MADQVESLKTRGEKKYHTLLGISFIVQLYSVLINIFVLLLMFVGVDAAIMSDHSSIDPRNLLSEKSINTID